MTAITRSSTAAWREAVWKAAANVTLVAALAISAFPLLWMLKSSFEPFQALVDPSLELRSPTFANYVRLFESTPFTTFFVNSIIAALGSTALSVTLAVMAGYGLARYHFPGKRIIARSVLFTYMFPALALAIPLFTVFGSVGLRNSLLGLVVAHATLSLPFSIWMMWQFFQTIPTSYRESAFTMGAGTVRTFVEVELPLASSGIVAIAIFAFALSWEDYTFAFTLVTDTNLRTLPVGITQFIERDFVNWGLIQSSAVLIAIPSIVIVLIAQRYLIAGLGSGGIKG